MLSDRKRFRKLVEETQQDRRIVRGLVAAKRYAYADEPDRFAKYVARKTAMELPRRGAEAFQGETFDLQAAWFLPEGARIRRAVAFVEVIDGSKIDAGSGFLVSPHLFMTNQHVVANELAARGASITFDREQGDNGRPAAQTSFLLDPDRFALFSNEDDLDYALIAVGQRNSGEMELADLGYCVLSDRGDKHVIGMNVNIIQHPRAWPKMITIRNNLLSYRTERTLLYETDTDHGSSGAPVFNDDWELVALHHWGEPFLEQNDEAGTEIPRTINEGVRISRIYKDLVGRLRNLTGEKRTLLGQALAYADAQSPPSAGKRLTAPHKSEVLAALDLPKERQMQLEKVPEYSGSTKVEAGTGEMRVVIPVEITVRIGSAAVPSISAVTQASQALDAALSAPRLLKPLATGAEKVKIDNEYSNRRGYDPQFIPGVVIPLPQPEKELVEQIAPLRTGEPNAEAGELLYEHFSIKMLKGKRVAAFTATNIDGTNYTDVDRDTGKVKVAEGETWYKDPRISASFFLDQSFYSSWSTYFDRGHLTRRIDPNWGPDEEAERANADTYHFTNCSPQHFRFNQTTRFWQGAERYILEQGGLAKDTKNRLTVFSGPVYDDKIDLWADDVQIPSSFFKVIVWRGKKGLRSVGLMVDQLALLGEARVGLKQASADQPISVEQWRESIESIEKETGLNFGDDVRKADTFKDGPQPSPGESRVFIRSLEGILPP